MVGALALLPEILAQVAVALRQPGLGTLLRLGSPVSALQLGLSTFPTGFGLSLLYQHLLGWLFLAMAASVVRHSWRRDTGASRPVAPAEAAATPSSGRPWSGLAARRARRLREAGPLGILAWRSVAIRRAVGWVTAASAVAACVCFALGAGSRTAAAQAAALAGEVIGYGLYALKLLLAIHVAYFMHDLARGGMLELMLTTPVRSYQLRSGHLAALREMFVRPVLGLGVLQILLSLAGRLLAGGDWPSPAALVLMAVAPPTLGMLVHGLDFVAVSFHVTVQAYRYDRPAKALLRSALLILLLPAIFCGWGRALVDLLVIGQYSTQLDRFRELAHGWFFPGIQARWFGAPRAG